ASRVVAMSVATAAVAGAFAGCADGTAPVDPLAAVVAITATGCRPTATNAVGTVIGDELVVTVAHAVAGEREITARTADGQELPAVVAAIDPGLDVAVLRIDGLAAAALAIRSYVDDDDVSLLGVHDELVDRRPVVVRRRVTIRTTDVYRQGEHLRPGLEVEAGVRSGDSGGGLVAADGSLLGLVWAASREADDRAWAVTSAAIVPLVAAAESGRSPDRARCSR
ncbi:MAG: trypsin-like peptidase domain-containing protein, partial [Actinomycetota bacterium]|nr:trypsin-like peptidase domain-containing protein [Actinomycetota bacterium]